MKLIIKEYLASLKERNELDALLPTLLSQMGLTILSEPSIGNRQFGVDISAVGSINNEPEAIYLFSIKAGNLGRQDWNSGNAQDLRPSLDEILDVYIPTHLPSEYKDLPIIICLTFGGDLKQEIEINLSQYTQAKETDQIKFAVWNGDRISGYLEKYLINEQLFLQDDLKSLLRKSLAMVDQPEISFQHFSRLIQKLFQDLQSQSIKNQLTTLRQSYLALGILNSWCLSENNIESSYLSAERLILHSWQVVKSFASKNTADARKIKNIFKFLTLLYLSISDSYYQRFLPHFSSLHAISNAVHGNCDVDINLRLFDVIGRISLFGIWVDWAFDRMYRNSADQNIIEDASRTHGEISEALKKLIINNPLLFHPYKDDQAIDIGLTAFYWLKNNENDGDLEGWLSGITRTILGAFTHNKRYPSNIHDYLELVLHPIDDSQEYRESVTKGSILYPLLGFFAEVFKNSEMHLDIKKITTEFIPKCTLQIWHPDADTETHLYSNSDTHGLGITGISNETRETPFNQIKENCSLDKYILELSAVKCDHFPIILTACRHYRLPIPYHFYFQLLGVDIYKDETKDQETEHEV